MYLKIKDPARYALLAQLLVLSVLFTVLLAIGIFLTVMAGSITFVWEQFTDFIHYASQEKGIFTAILVQIAPIAILVGLIAGFIDWYQKRKLWNTPHTIYALDFGTDGVTVHSRSQTRFLPYRETSFFVDGELVTVRTKNGSHAALSALTLTFLQDGHRTKVRHLPSASLIYQLADFHRYFKEMSFQFTPTSSYDTDQKELAHFFKEQVENQRRYGLHRKYRSYFFLTVGGLLFLSLGSVALWLELVVLGFVPRELMSWVFLLLGAGMFAGGTGLLCGIWKDWNVSRRIKKMRSFPN